MSFWRLKSPTEVFLDQVSNQVELDSVIRVIRSDTTVTKSGANQSTLDDQNFNDLMTVHA